MVGVGGGHGSRVLCWWACAGEGVSGDQEGEEESWDESVEDGSVGRRFGRSCRR
jgi:hypothetical protein